MFVAKCLFDVYDYLIYVLTHLCNVIIIPTLGNYLIPRVLKKIYYLLKTQLNLNLICLFKIIIPTNTVVYT